MYYISDGAAFQKQLAEEFPRPFLLPGELKVTIARLVIAFFLALLDVVGRLWLAAHGHGFGNGMDIVAMIGLFLTAQRPNSK